MITSVVDLWTAFWFAPVSPIDLGVARAIVLGYFLFFKLPEQSLDFYAWKRAYFLFQDQWQSPWLMRVLRASIAPKSSYELIVRVYKLSLFFGAIGFCSQISCAVALILGLYLKSVRHGIRPHHPVIPIHFCLLAFAIAPSGAAFSLDSLLNWFQILPSDQVPEIAGWGIRLIQVTIALMIFATGFSKLRNCSSQFTFWQRGHLSDLMRLHDFPFCFFRPIKSISGFISYSRPIEFAAAIGTVIIETLYPLVLFFPATQALLIIPFLGMVLGFRIFVGARFDFISATIVATYIPWSKIAAHFAGS